MNTRHWFVVPILGPQLTFVRGSCDAPLKANIDLIFIEICLAFGVTARDKVVQAFRPGVGRIVEGIRFFRYRWRRDSSADGSSNSGLAGERWRRFAQVWHLHWRGEVSTCRRTRWHQWRNSPIVEHLLVVLLLVGHVVHVILILLLLFLTHRLIVLIELLLMLLLLMLLLLRRRWQLRRTIRQGIVLYQGTNPLWLFVNIESNRTKLAWRLFESLHISILLLLLLLLLMLRAKK